MLRDLVLADAIRLFHEELLVEDIRSIPLIAREALRLPTESEIIRYGQEFDALVGA